jgi:hypothetical protein
MSAIGKEALLFNSGSLGHSGIFQGKISLRIMGKHGTTDLRAICLKDFLKCHN